MDIYEFNGDFRFLSNFYPCEIIYKGKIYKTSEHLFQSLKTKDKEEMEFIRLSSSPGIAKKNGRKIKLRDDWGKIKNEIMKLVVMKKFSQNPTLLNKLNGTKGIYLTEGNYWHDNYWGDCRCNKCQWFDGENHLGKIIMDLRDNYFSKR